MYAIFSQEDSENNNRVNDSNLRHNLLMDTIGQRVKAIRLEIGLTQVQLAKKAGMKQSTLSDLERGRNDSTMELVNLASALNCRPEWLMKGKGDKYYGLQDVYLSPAKIKENSNLVEINQYDAGGRMGNGGLILQDQPGTIRRLEVSKEWLNQNVKGVSPASQLCIVTGFGDSMKPMYNPGDPLLVDLSIKIVEFDAVYFFRVGDEGFIKRIQRIPGKGLVAISANRDHYEPWTVTQDMDFEVIGRVLKVWKGDDF